MKEADTNYMTDQTQMKKLNILTTGKNYWIVSRNVDSNSSICSFKVRIVDINGTLGSRGLCFVRSSGYISGGSDENGLRPCFALKSDIKITGGKGTIGNPYTM